MVELFWLSFIGWSIVGSQPYCPQSLGGLGDMQMMFPAGRRSVPWDLAAFHAVRFSYLLEWWIFEDGFERPYLTMHHVATSALLLLAVFVGEARIGSLIIFLHDIPNLPLQLLLWLQGVRVPTAVLATVYLANLYTWAHCALYSFPVEVAAASVTRSHSETLEWKVTWCMFAVLLVHHAYAYFRLLSYVPNLDGRNCAIVVAESLARVTQRIFSGYF